MLLTLWEEDPGSQTGPGHPSGLTMGHDLPQGSVFQDKLLFRMYYPLRINASACLCLLSPKLSIYERKQGKNGNLVQPVSNVAQTGNKRRLQWPGPLKCPLSKQNYSHIWFQDSKSTRVTCPLWYEVENKEITSQVVQWWRISLPMQEMQETRVQSLGGKIPWRRKWQPTPVLLPGKSHGQRSLVGYRPWGCKESDITEQLSTWHRKQTEGLDALLLKTPDTIFL